MITTSHLIAKAYHAPHKLALLFSSALPYIPCIIMESFSLILLTKLRIRVMIGQVACQSNPRGQQG
ncbi:MAG: hypothetical protein ACRC9V_14905, partial [Aeromonas sp.]